MVVDEVVLTGVIQQVLQDDSATIGAWDIQPLAHEIVSLNTAGIYRISGNVPQAWSVIVKVINPPQNPAYDTPDYPYFWRREALIYQSGILSDLPPGVAAPRYYETTHQPDGSMWLWIEDVTSTEAWTRDRLLLAARQIGRMGGRYIVDQPLPTQSFLSRDLMRAWVGQNAGLIERARHPAVWQHPLLAVYSRDIGAAISDLWNTCHRFFAGLDKLPRTLVHHDLWQKNMFSRPDYYGDAETVLIDWEVAGHGAPGEDVGNLLGAGLLNFDIEIGEAEDLADVLLISYLNGMQDAGWRGDPQPIRFAFNTAAALRNVFSTACWPLAIVQDKSGQYIAETEQRWQRPIEVILGHWSAVTEFLLSRAAEAHHYLKTLNV